MKLKNIDGCFFINLDKRVDRLQHINDTLPFDSERVSAVNASMLQLTDEIKKLFPLIYKKVKKAEIACTLSHYYLWKKLVNDEYAQNYLILEDDVCFNENFLRFWNGRYADNIPECFDVIYLGGCQPYNKPYYKNVTESYNLYFNRIKNNDYFSKNNHFWHMTTCSYIISKTAAIKACKWIDAYGFNSVIDHFMINFFNHNPSYGNPDNFYHINPLMANQIHEENDNIKLDDNSDIRFSEDKFTDLPVDIHRTTIINGKPKLQSDELAPIKIGKYCAIGENFKIITLNHDYNFPAMQGSIYLKNFGKKHPGEINIPPSRQRTKGGVNIGNDVCIGDNVFICSGVNIGDGCYIGAGSIVTKDMPPYSICAGVPCSKIKSRFKVDIVNLLLSIKWWNWGEDKIKRNEKFFNCNLNESDESYVRSVINE